MGAQSSLTVSDVAAALQYHPNKVRSLIAAGELPAWRHGPHWRIESKDLETFIQARKTRGHNRTKLGRLKPLVGGR